MLDGGKLSAMMRKFRQIQWNDPLFLAEAMFMLALSAIVIAILPFPYAGRLSSLGISRPEPSGEGRTHIVKRIRWAVIASARRVPWRAMCFEQGLAAQMMLRRRGIASVLYFGAAMNDPKGLAAHV